MLFRSLSAAVLGMVWLYFYPAVGVVMLAIAVLICLLRVLSGAHFVRDVLAGNTISGIMRLTESLIWTGALVIGFMGAIWLAA